MLARINAQGRRLALFAILAATLAQGCATRGPGPSGGTTPDIWPLRDPRMVISSPFGDQRSIHRHKGVDLQVPEGTPAYTTADGTVTFSGEQRNYGKIIIVEHNPRLSTAYAHLKKRHVEQGDAVRKGQHIGDVGKTGNATTHHLHYEVRENGVPVNPMGYLPR